MADKPKPTLRIQSDEEARQSRDQATFDGWITECAEMQERWVEGLLSQMPSLQEHG